MNQLQIHTPHFTVSSPVNELKQSCDSSGQQLILLSFAHNYHYVTFPVWSASQTTLSHPEQHNLSVKQAFVTLTKCHGWTGEVQEVVRWVSVKPPARLHSSMCSRVNEPWGQSGRSFWRGGSSPPPGSAWWTAWPPPRSETPSAPGSRTAPLQRPWNTNAHHSPVNRSHS